MTSPVAVRGAVRGAPSYVFHLIPHTHWDREWYLPRAAFQARLVPVLDDLVARLEAEPAYRTFLLDGQTIHLEDYLAAQPDARPRVAALVAAGRLQAGPWYVLADEQIPSAESLVRNLLLGARDAARLCGRLDVMYSPDAFGHPAVWPTLAREFGLAYGALWRGVITSRDLFRWRGPDGARVLVYHLPEDGYEIGGALPAAADALPAAWAAVRAALVRRAATRHVAVFVGADHHAAHPAVPALRDRLAALEPGGDVRISRLDEFLAAADADARDAALPELAGELRWSYGYTWTLQGVHATRARQKRRNAEAELWLERAAEPLAALARWGGGRDRRPLLELAWRALVAGQFHDTLGGCASDAVAAALDQRQAEVESYAREIARGALHELVGHDADEARERAGLAHPALALWNPAARARGGVVIAELTGFVRDVFVGPPSERVPGSGAGWQPVDLVAADGTLVPLQVLHHERALERRDAARHYPDLDEVERVRVAFRAPEIAGFGVAMLAPAPSAAEPSPSAATAAGRTLETAALRVTLEDDATLTVVDRRSGRSWIGLLAAESGGDAGDTYSYAAPAGDRVVRAAGPAAVRVLAGGPLVAALEGSWRLAGARGGEVELRATVQLQADSPLVRVTLEVDNRARDHRLRLRFPTGTRAAEALAGGQFGAVRRAPVTLDPADYPRETPVRTAPAHRFVAAADDAGGLALLAPGFFEYEWDAAGDLYFTVLRAVGELSRADVATRPGHAGWPQPTPEAQCQGVERLQLALLPLGPGEADEASILAAWEDAFQPIRPLWLRQTLAPAPPGRSVELEGAGLVFSALKPAEDGEGIVLRCYNATDGAVSGRWRLGESVRRAEQVRADETAAAPLATEDGGRTVAFVAPGRGVVTVRVVA